jgi:hypothetical protein
VLLEKFVSPEYEAVIVLLPELVEVRLHFAADMLAEQVAVPSLTVTVPVGAPAPGETMATLKSTSYDCPTADAVASGVAFVIDVVVLACVTVSGSDAVEPASDPDAVKLAPIPAG